jgi:hypothetical protein
MGLAVDSVVVFDCEHLTDETSPSRFWCGPDDPDPLLVQIGAVRLSLTPPFALGDSFDCIVAPVGRAGPIAPSQFFTRLTGIDAARIAREGRPLCRALEDFAAFAGGDAIWSWGKDEITSLAPSCFVAGMVSPLPAACFGNAAALLVKAGVPLATVHGLRSHTIAAHFGMPPEPRAHDGLADARAVARVLGHLMAEGRLTPDDLRRA